MNRLNMIPERQEFFAKEVSTGIKFAIVPMLDPPMIAQTSIKTPSIRQVFPLVMLAAIRREFDYLSVKRLELSGEGSPCYCDLEPYYFPPVA